MIQLGAKNLISSWRMMIVHFNRKGGGGGHQRGTGDAEDAGSQGQKPTGKAEDAKSQSQKAVDLSLDGYDGCQRAAHRKVRKPPHPTPRTENTVGSGHDQHHLTIGPATSKANHKLLLGAA